MDEYKCVYIMPTERQTTMMLNDLSMNGWELVCSYARGDYLILKRKLK